MDDLNLMSDSKEGLVHTLQVVTEYVQHFCLSLSLLKTRIWCTSSVEADEIAKKFGCGTTQSVAALGLGGQWPVVKVPSEECAYEKEMGRVDKTLARLERLRVLPVHPVDKLGLAATGCLSPLAYLNGPTLQPLKEIKSRLELALGLRWAAPEILYVGLASAFLDPELIWLLTGLGLWFRVLLCGMNQEMIQAVIKVRPRARLGNIAVEARKKGVIVCPDGLRVGEQLLGLNQDWKEMRASPERHLRSREFAALALRRPETFGGMTLLNARIMRKFARSLDNYSAMVLLKVWTGSTMVGARKQLITKEPHPCRCGEPNQSLRHLLWECPLHLVPPSSDLWEWAGQENFMSVSHLLATGMSNKLVAIWTRSCLRLVHLLSAYNRERRDPEAGIGGERRANGHDVVLTADSTYAYCAKCKIARRVTQAKWIFCKPCRAVDEAPTYEGQEFSLMGHTGTMVMERWKVCGLRPKLRCKRCLSSVWATAGFSNRCPKEEALP